MTRFLSTFCFSLFFVLPRGVSAQGGECEEQRAHLLSLLRQGVELTQRRAQEVQTSSVLSEVTRGEFRQSAEWLSAWLRDHAERLAVPRGVLSLSKDALRGGMNDCAVLPQVANDAHVQILPFYLMSLRASASLTIFAIDQLPREERTPFEEARGLLREVLEGDRDAEGMRVTMRHAAFLVHQGLRFLRTRGIME